MTIERERIADKVEPTERNRTVSGSIQPGVTPEPDRNRPVPTNVDRNNIVVVPLPSHVPIAEPAPSRSPGISQHDVQVAPNLRELVATTPLAAPLDDTYIKERRDLNEIVHGVLIIGLTISTALMLAGVGLALFYGRDLPTAVPDIHEVIGRVLTLRPSGFLALGLLVLIATPILRVVGSIGAFLYERDWRFAAITSLVLGILVISLLLGRG